MNKFYKMEEFQMEDSLKISDSVLECLATPLRFLNVSLVY